MGNFWTGLKMFSGRWVVSSLGSLGRLWPPVQLERGAVGPIVWSQVEGVPYFLNLRIIVIVFINSFKDFFLLCF